VNDLLEDLAARQVAQLTYSYQVRGYGL